MTTNTELDRTPMTTPTSADVIATFLQSFGVITPTGAPWTGLTREELMANAPTVVAREAPPAQAAVHPVPRSPSAMDNEATADWKRRVKELSDSADRDRQRANRFHALAAMASVSAMPARGAQRGTPGAFRRRPGEPTRAARKASRKAAKAARRTQR